MTKIEKLFKILNNNGRLFKIYSNPQEILAKEERTYRVTDKLKVEYETNGYWVESILSFQDILDNQIILVNNDYTEEQKEICKTLYKIGYRYLARRKDDSLCAFVEYPLRDNEGWDTRYTWEPKCPISYDFPQICISSSNPIVIKGIYEEEII